MNQVMSKRRVISDSPARRVIRINSPSQSARSSACVIRTGRAVCGDCTRTLPSPALAMTMKPPSRSAAMAGKGVFASRDQSLRQARALRPRSLAHRSISGAPIFVVPSRCLICSRSAATPWKCRSVTRDSSPGSAGVALFDSVLTYGLRGSMSPQACGCARTGCWIAAASAIGAAPWPTPAVTKVDAMDWPSKAAAAPAGGAPTGDWMTTPLPVSLVEDVLTRTADQDVVAGIAMQDVVAGAADHDVVTVAAIDDELHAGQTGRHDHVIAAETVDDEVVIAVEVRDRHRLRQTRHSHHAVVGGDA